MQPRASSRWSIILPVALAALIAILLRLPVLGLPLERDEGAYGLIAASWLKGALPYRDLFDHKPPLIYFLYMPAMSGTPGPVPLRIWQTCLFVLHLPLLYMIGRRVYGHTAAILAMLIYAVVGSAFQLQGLIFNTEQALTLSALITLLILVRGADDDRVRWPLLYGFFLGLISLIKPTAVPLLLLLLLLFRVPSPWTHLRNIVAATLLMLAPWLPVAGYWGSAGALPDLRFALLDYNRLYTQESTMRWTTAGIVDMLAPLAPLLVCAPGGIITGEGVAGLRGRMAVTFWTLAFLGAGLIGLRPYIHYYYPALPGLALLAAPTFLSLAQQVWPAFGVRRLLGVAGPITLLTLLLLPLMLGNFRLIGRTPNEQATSLYGPDGQYYFGPAEQVATYIKRVTKPDERIFVWASEPEIYLLAERRPASRFIFDYPLRLLPEAQAKLQHDLALQPPALIITYHGVRPIGMEAVATRLNLRLTSTIGGYDLWTPAGLAQP